MTERKKSFEQAARDIDLRLGDMLGHLGSALDEVVSRLGEAEDGGEIRRERRFDTESGPIRASAGIRIRTLGGSASASTEDRRAPDQPINPNRKPAEPPKSGPPLRDVEATIFQDADAWMLVADMPGITREEVTWQVQDGALRVEGRSGARHYRVDTDWPDGASEADLDCTIANGIVELRTKVRPA